jgi:hypothetical protein
MKISYDIIEYHGIDSLKITFNDGPKIYEIQDFYKPEEHCYRRVTMHILRFLSSYFNRVCDCDFANDIKILTCGDVAVPIEFDNEELFFNNVRLFLSCIEESCKKVDLRLVDILVFKNITGEYICYLKYMDKGPLFTLTGSSMHKSIAIKNSFDGIIDILRGDFALNLCKSYMSDTMFNFFYNNSEIQLPLGDIQQFNLFIDTVNGDK